MGARNYLISPICVDNFSYDGLMSLFDTIEDLNAKYALSIEFAGMFMTRVQEEQPYINKCLKVMRICLVTNSFLCQ